MLTEEISQHSHNLPRLREIPLQKLLKIHSFQSFPRFQRQQGFDSFDLIFYEEVEIGAKE